MTDIWYITSSTDGGYYLNNPTVAKTPPNTNFKPYYIPAIWSNMLPNSIEILLDSTTVDSLEYVFMSKNSNKLEKLIHMWNSFAEQTEDYIDWD